MMPCFWVKLSFFLYTKASFSWQALLRCDLPFYMVPFTTEDLKFTKPEVCEQSTSLPESYLVSYSFQFKLLPMKFLDLGVQIIILITV